jgi:hypothetical protein
LVGAGYLIPVPPKVARMTVVISAVITALAVVAKVAGTRA